MSVLSEIIKLLESVENDTDDYVEEDGSFRKRRNVHYDICKSLSRLNNFNREYIKFQKELEELSAEADKQSSFEVLTQFHSGENQAYENIIFMLEELDKE